MYNSPCFNTETRNLLVINKNIFKRLKYKFVSKYPFGLPFGKEKMAVITVLILYTHFIIRTLVIAKQMMSCVSYLFLQLVL
jgi:hypothetical protein